MDHGEFDQGPSLLVGVSALSQPITTQYVSLHAASPWTCIYNRYIYINMTCGYVYIPGLNTYATHEGFVVQAFKRTTNPTSRFTGSQCQAQSLRRVVTLRMPTGPEFSQNFVDVVQESATHPSKDQWLASPALLYLYTCNRHIQYYIYNICIIIYILQQ